MFVIVCNVPLLNYLTSVSVSHLLETPWLFTWCIMKTKWFIFLYLFIYLQINFFIYIEREIEIRTNILSNFPLQVKLGHWFYISQKHFWKLKKTWKLCKYFCPLYKNPSPFRKFSTRMWQNARANTVRRAMVCDAYFPFSKFL